MELVEFAMVFPVIMLLFFGIIDFGRFFFDQHTLQFATREGARVGLTGRQVTDNGNTLSRTASIIKTIQDYAAIAIHPGDVSISIYPVNPDYSDPVGWNGTQDSGPPGAYMRVRTQYTFDFLIPYVSFDKVVIQAESTYRNESF